MQRSYISQVQDQVNGYQTAYIGQRQAWDEAIQQRTEQGILQVIEGIGAVIAGGTLIVCSMGLATPLVVGACVVGGGAMVYGASNAAEGSANIYLGLTGDARTAAVNPIRDTIFANNPALYYTLGNACVLAASIVVPVGGAMSRAVGGTTAVLRAGITEVGKLTLSGGAGMLTSQYVAGQTGSELLGNLAGGFAGGLTYGGLNTLDTRINVSGLHPSTSVKPVSGIDQKPKTTGNEGGTYSNDVIQYEKLKSQYAADEIYNAERVGSGLKDDPTHRAASYLSKDQLANGRTYSFTGGDNKSYTLLQTKGQLDGVDGIFEYVTNDIGQVTYQRFIKGGNYTGFPNQSVPKGGY